MIIYSLKLYKSYSEVVFSVKYLLADQIFALNVKRVVGRFTCEEGEAIAVWPLKRLDFLLTFLAIRLNDLL